MNPDSVPRSPALLPLVAVVAGPTATILNQDPPVTSNKARELHGLPPALDWHGRPLVADPLHFQRLAAPVTVYVDAFSAHPLEVDAAARFAPPDGYLDVSGIFSKERRAATDRPVYAITLLPEDGLYPLPYMARRADGSAWERHSPAIGPDGSVRQTFWPDARRFLEEIERTASHLNGNLSARARFAFHRAAPSAGPSPEKAGVAFFPYGYCEHFPPQPLLAEITHTVQQALADPDVRGLVWLEGSPRIAETLYWLQLLIDTDRPIVGAAAQRPNHRLGADGAQQFVDAVDYVLSTAWADETGRDRAGAVLVSDQRILAAREAAKASGRPGGFTTLGGHGGMLGTTSGPQLTFLPVRRHGRQSLLRISALPDTVAGFSGPVAIKDTAGQLHAEAIPHVEIAALPGWMAHAGGPDNAVAAQIREATARIRTSAPLGGLVAEGVTGGHFEETEATALDLAAHHGLPVVKVGRDAPESFVPAPGHRLWIGGGNLTAAKARVLLMACLLRFGVLPAAANPLDPTAAERAAIRARLAEFQVIFDTH
jgi:L-asparaginase